MKLKNQEVFKEVYEEYYQLHSSWKAIPEDHYYYLHREWFFPNHIDLVLEHVMNLHKNYLPEADLEVSMFAGLLHDSGLVYKRDEPSPDGHESRSCEYAQLILEKHGLDSEFIEAVVVAIEATDAGNVADSKEAELVRNADAYSHLTSVHFWAKAKFAREIGYYLSWLEKKIHTTLSKLTIQDLIDEITPVVDRYQDMLTKHKENMGSKFIDRM
jgi:HD superfamily phosphodiesterase